MFINFTKGTGKQHKQENVLLKGASIMSIEITSKGFEDNDELLRFIRENIDIHNQEMLHKLGESIVAEAKSNLQNNTNINSVTLLSSITIKY